MNTELTGEEVYTLEDIVYDEFHDAAGRGSATYDREDFLQLFHVAESVDPTNLSEVDREDNLTGVVLVDDYDKAAYGFIDHERDSVELNIKCFGDRVGVINYIENLPSGGYTRGVDSVSGQAMKNAAVDAGEHPLNVETDTSLAEPGETPDDGFTNAQAERIKDQVLEEEPETW